MRNATVIDSKVYCGGVTGFAIECTVYCYDTSKDKWTTLPPLPVINFGLGQVNGELVAIGGWKKSDEEETNEVYTYYYDEQSQARMWKQTIPPMPTARCSPGVFSLQSALVVVGGVQVTQSLRHEPTACTEIFKPDTLQWYYRTDPLPRNDMTLVASGNTCYALGGFERPLYHSQALYASLDDLLDKAIPADQTTHSGRCRRQPAWKPLPNTPNYQPAAAVLDGNLLAIGGNVERCGRPDKKIFMYTRSTNSWIHVSDLPARRLDPTIAVLSSTEILVIGGWNGDNPYGSTSMNTVYTGTMHTT